MVNLWKVKQSLVTVICLLFLFGCEPPTPTQVRGRLDPSLLSSTDGQGSVRALSDLASIAVLIEQIDEEQVADSEPVVETSPIQGDGSFEAGLPPQETGKSSLIMVQDPARGVGIQSLIGLIELPVANESSNTWPLDRLGTGEQVDLGTVGGEGDTLLPSTDEAILLGQMDLAQAELIFAAQRDNYRQFAANRYFNQNSPWDVRLLLDAPIAILDDNRWRADVEGSVGPEEVVAALQNDATNELGPSIFIWMLDRENAAVTSDQIFSGAVDLEIIPPQGVTQHADPNTVYGPNNPITSVAFNEEDLNNWFDTYNLPIPDGPWLINIDGQTLASYNFKSVDLYDNDGNFLYFIPTFELTVATDEVGEYLESVRVQWHVYDRASDSYTQVASSSEIFDDFNQSWSNELPLIGGWDLFVRSSDVRSNDGDGQSFGFGPAGEPGNADNELFVLRRGEPIRRIYMPGVGDETNNLQDLQFKYNLGGVEVTIYIGLPGFST